MCFHPSNFGLPKSVHSRVRSRHATDRQTDGRTDRHRRSFYNAPPLRRRGHYNHRPVSLHLLKTTMMTANAAMAAMPRRIRKVRNFVLSSCSTSAATVTGWIEASTLPFPSAIWRVTTWPSGYLSPSVQQNTVHNVNLTCTCYKSIDATAVGKDY